MLFALTDEAHQELKAMFEKHDLERKYTAIVEGKMEQSSGTWQSYLYEDDNYYVHSGSDPKQGHLRLLTFRWKKLRPLHMDRSDFGNGKKIRSEFIVKWLVIRSPEIKNMGLSRIPLNGCAFMPTILLLNILLPAR